MAEKYIEPKKDARSYTCPHCNTISQMEHAYHYFQDDIDGVSHGGVHFKNRLNIHRCQCCGQKIIWIDEEYIYPDIIAEQANDDMPVSVKQLYNEAALIYNKSPRAACALLRLAIDRLCNELGETDRDINKNIGALVQKGLPQIVQQALDVVRVIGNKAVHPGQIEFNVDNKDTAMMLMHLLNVITSRMITEPNKIGDLFQKLPETTKDAIKRRDN